MWVIQHDLVRKSMMYLSGSPLPARGLYELHTRNLDTLTYNVELVYTSHSGQ